MLSSVIRRTWLALGLVALAGCSGDSLRLAPVVGQVSMPDRTLTTGTVSFRPDAGRGNTSLHHPTGVLDATGRYELYTVGKKGAPPGWYRVLVFADGNATPTKTAHPAPPRWIINPRYTSEQSTDLLIEVVEKPEAGRYDLQVKP